MRCSEPHPADLEGDRLVPSRHFSTTALPGSEQFGAWARHTSTSHLRPATSGAFFARSTFWTLQDLTLSNLELDAFTAARDERLIARCPADHLFLIVVVKGTIALSHSGGNQLCEAGDACLLDLSKPMTTASTRQHSIRLPRTAETTLLANFLISLTHQMPLTRESSIVPLSRICRDLLATAIQDQSLEAQQEEGPKATRKRAVRYIVEQPPGALSITVMMRDLRLTRASLYRLFRADGGVLAFDRKRRLRLLHRALADPLEHRAIGELGFAHGFGDQANLSRQFRAAFGYTMGELRRHLRATSRPTPTASAADACQVYREAVAALSS